MRSQRANAFAVPAVAIAGKQPVSVQDAGNDIVVRNQSELLDGFDDVRRRAVALAAPSSRQAQFGMDTTDPVNDQYNLAGVGIDVGDHLVNEGPYNAFFEPCIRCRSGPDGLQIIGQGGEGHRRCGLTGNRQGIVSGDLRFDINLPGKSRIPSRFQFSRDEPVGRVRGIVLPEGAGRGVTSGFEIPHQRFANPIAPLGSFALCLYRRLDGARSDNLKQCFLDGVIHP